VASALGFPTSRAAFDGSNRAPAGDQGTIRSVITSRERVATKWPDGAGDFANAATNRTWGRTNSGSSNHSPGTEIDCPTTGTHGPRDGLVEHAESARSIVPRSTKAQDELGIEETEHLHFIRPTYAKQQLTRDSGTVIR
jgi:hypothetical protein